MCHHLVCVQAHVQPYQLPRPTSNEQERLPQQSCCGECIVYVQLGRVVGRYVLRAKHHHRAANGVQVRELHVAALLERPQHILGHFCGDGRGALWQHNLRVCKRVW